MDFIFGTLATDSLKLVHHRALRSGIQHNSAITPRDPLPGEPVRITVIVGEDCPVDQVVCYYTVDGSIPRGHYGIAERGSAIPLSLERVEWDTLLWAYVSIWTGTLPPQADHTTVRYVIGGWQAGDAEVYADYPNAQRVAESAASAFFRGEAPPEVTPDLDATTQHVFSYHVDTFRAPQWAHDSVIYQIFVDRFNPGKGRTWLQTDDLNGIVGGTLWGVLEKLDYIAVLGATCIWLSPIWPTPSHHGYDVTDHTLTDPRLGGDEALRAVINEAHKMGIRIVLDLVANHISNEHPIFEGAYTDPQSPHREWFIFDDSPLGYRSFFGVKTMPQVNLQNPDARRWMLDVARYWIREFDIDGYRLDYATGPSLDFWSDFRTAIRAEKSDVFCFAEAVDAPEMLQGYVGRLDGCLDFYGSEVLRKAFGWRTMSPAAAAQTLNRQRLYFPTDFILPTFVDNHDMDRFLWIAKGDKDALLQAVSLQMSLPAPPVIYYGTEVGLSQRVSVREGMGLHQSRTPMVWGDAQDKDLHTAYKRLIAGRKQLVRA